MGKHALHPSGPSTVQPVAFGEIRPQEAINRLAGHTELYADVVASLLDDSAGTVKKLHAAVAAGEIIRARDAAHSLKGLAAVCGAVSVAGVAAAMEQAAQSGHTAMLPQLARCLDAELAYAATALKAYRPAVDDSQQGEGV